METVLFWLFAFLTIAGALGVVLSRNPLNGAMALVGSFFALAGLFLLLQAQLIAALQVLVYAGAIMVLFLFVIMLLNLDPRDLSPGKFGLGAAIGVAAAAAIGGFLLRLISKVSQIQQLPGADFGGVAPVGRLLYGPYTLPFEAVSLLLLTAIVAAVVVAKGRI